MSKWVDPKLNILVPMAGTRAVGLKKLDIFLLSQ